MVLCDEPESVGDDPESAVAILHQLGCRVTCARFDLGGLDEESLLGRAPNIVLVDAGDELHRGQRALKKLAQSNLLSDVPKLLTVTIPRLSGLDFSIGFDDFVLRPIVPAELYARLRQLDWRTAAFGSDERVKIADLVIDLAGYEAHLHGRRLEFTHQEFELLKFLAQHRGRVFTRDQLLQRVWGYEYTGGTRTVDIHVRRIRAKLGNEAGSLIETVRNVGYKVRGLREDEES
ncbi:winged helix-turn-helix transcriptional regulator [Haliangium sp.]|uniref:winged helix-turn-helix transcriptional regulator n=1 Tax=Haliangium sp. TaxID=2663208 RepID=UPI003D0E7DF9